jgi:hypothetical protein
LFDVVAADNAILSIDHDDGSNHYLDTMNVLMYSGQKNYIGWEKHAVQNLYIRPDLADSREETSSVEACEDNSCESIVASPALAFQLPAMRVRSS